MTSGLISARSPLAVSPPDTNPLAWEEEDYAAVEIEDDEPVDSLISEKQQRLAVNSLYGSYAPGVPFLVAANVGLFYAKGSPAIVPDVMVSLHVQVPEDWTQKKNRSYFVAVLGKPPEIAVEIVSNDKGNEQGSKFRDYAAIGVLYYVIFDPLQILSSQVLQAFELRNGEYVALDTPWFEVLGLGLTLWQGTFERREAVWLRWCDRSGQLLLTGDERATQERQRASQARHQATQARLLAAQERQRAEQEQAIAAQERQRAEQERQRAEQERQRAEAAETALQAERDRAALAEQRAAELAERLRALETGEP